MPNKKKHTKKAKPEEKQPTETPQSEFCPLIGYDCLGLGGCKFYDKCVNDGVIVIAAKNTKP